MAHDILVSVKGKNEEITLTKTDKLSLIPIEDVRNEVIELKAKIGGEFNKFTPKGFLRFPIHQDNRTFCVHPNGYVIDDEFNEVKYFKGEDGLIYIEAGELKIDLIKVMVNNFTYNPEILTAFTKEVTMAGEQMVVRKDRMGKVFKNVAEENLRQYDLTLLYDNIVSVHQGEQ